MKHPIGWTIACVMSTSIAHAGMNDLLNQAVPLLNQAIPSVETNRNATGGGLAGLTQMEMSGGLKEALSVGVRRAIQGLGRQNGFLNDPQVKIPLPPALQPMESLLKMGMAKGVGDHFIATLNQAAEKATPVTADIFAKAIRGMTVQDAAGILRGPDNAATEYFRKATSAELTTAIKPIVVKTTQAAGVGPAYQSLTGALPKSGLNLLSGLTGQDVADLDGYVTGKTLDGIFLKLAGEEKMIRANPAARSSDLLRKVFGSRDGK
ncbi:MAG: DUF4197 domain-containing protein [Magnetococcales bacterium]|nr:DUF4197 domain-containing protein [Magnetococcales bacterium]